MHVCVHVRVRACVCVCVCDIHTPSTHSVSNDVSAIGHIMTGSLDLKQPLRYHAPTDYSLWIDNQHSPRGGTTT